MSNAATLSVQTPRLLKALEFAFTNTATAIPELLQNARRASASEVRFSVDVGADERTDLTVVDDGVGIGDLTILLQLAASGWSEELCAQENPYGMGFLACLFACETIEVVSRGARLCALTSDILDLKPVEITPVIPAHEPTWGATSISLRGCRFDKAEIIRVLTGSARGFPIVVLINGLELPRPHALTGPLSDAFVQTTVGTMSIMGIDTVEVSVPPAEISFSGVRLYLQGLPISNGSATSCNWADQAVVHLDAERFTARWPDRDILHNGHGLRAEVKEVFQQRLAEFLAEELKRRGLDGFIETYHRTHARAAAAILATAPFVHNALLSGAHYPSRGQSLRGRDTYGARHVANLVPEDLACGATLLFDLSEDYDPEENGMSWMCVFAQPDRCFGVEDPEKLPHWAREHLLDDSHLRVEMDEPGRETVYVSCMGECSVLFCKRYRIVNAASGDTLVRIFNDAAYLPVPSGAADARLCIVVPDGETSGQVVLQAYDYFNSDYDRDDDMDREAAAFSLMLLNERGECAQVLQEIIASSQASSLEKLRGTTYRVAITSDGGIQVTLEAPPGA